MKYILAVVLVFRKEKLFPTPHHAIYISQQLHHEPVNPIHPIPWAPGPPAKIIEPVNITFQKAAPPLSYASVPSYSPWIRRCREIWNIQAWIRASKGYISGIIYGKKIPRIYVSATRSKHLYLKPPPPQIWIYKGYIMAALMTLECRNLKLFFFGYRVSIASVIGYST